MSITKADVVAKVYEDLKTEYNFLDPKECKDIVERLFEEISNALSLGEEVKVHEFGHFSVRHKNERVGRNPRTLEVKIINKRRVVVFHVGPKFKQALNAMVLETDVLPEEKVQEAG